VSRPHRPGLRTPFEREPGAQRGARGILGPQWRPLHAIRAGPDPLRPRSLGQLKAPQRPVILPALRLQRTLAYLIFGLAVFGSALVGERTSLAVNQSVVWLPTGVAIAGVWALGARSAWVVVLAIFWHRFRADQETAACLLAGLGTMAEGLLGSWVMRRLALDEEFARLRDVLVLFAAAAIAPLASIAFSRLAGAAFPSDPMAPFYSGWVGWWRMNALGALIVVPLVLSWRSWRSSRTSMAGWLEGALLMVATIALVTSVMTLMQPSIEAILTLYAVLPVALVAALRFGPRGAITTATLGTLLVAILSSLDGGAFLDISRTERHNAIQITGLSLVSIPLVIGSLIAERERRVRDTKQQLALQARVLELVVRGESMARVLEELTLGMESCLPGRWCSVLRLEGRRLRLAAAPSLPEAYNRLVDGLEIGPDVGSCGKAAHDGINVVAVDLQTEPSWRNYRDVARLHGLGSCWSIPIRTASGTVLGTFAVYGPVPAAPAPGQLALCERAATLAGIALDRERREETLRRAQKLEAVGKLAGGVAHDFNNLLTGVAGFAESLQLELPEESESRRDVEEIQRAVERGAALTRQLLAFSSRPVLSLRVLDLAEVVSRLTGMLHRLIGEHIRLTAHSEGDCRVRADRGQIEQVLMNLVLNARDAMTAGGELTIATAHVRVAARPAPGFPDLVPGSYVLLSVKDTGAGMSDEVLANAFDPFFTTKEPGRGTGIGLSTVYGIVKQAGGFIRIDSSPDFGTTVNIWLLHAPEESDLESDVLTPRAPASRATILLAEDEPAVLEFVQASLERSGHRVLAAPDGRAALALARAHPEPIDLVVTDVVMPELGGPELVRELRRDRPELPALFMSGYPSGLESEPSSRSGRVALLSKPFTSARLHECVAELLGRVPEPGPGPQRRSSGVSL
jgi:two-component system cell cycle sensor histidine kinase/response regulator CckA